MKKKGTLIYLISLLLLIGMGNLSAKNITGRAGKIWYSNGYLYTNIVNKGILVVDNRNPSVPRKVGFIEIPGNIDMAVNGEVLYANHHDDLIAIDISDFHAIGNDKVLRRIDAVFPNRRNAFSGGGNINWISKPIYVKKGKGIVSSSVNVANTSKGGSMSCMTLMNNYLYTITDRHLNVFDVATPSLPEQIGKRISVKGMFRKDLETVFATSNRLYIGSKSGMYIYGLGNPEKPRLEGRYEHTISCDPVVVEGQYAYVTLREGTECRRTVNRFDIVNISNPRNPVRMSTHAMTNPRGLSIDNGIAFICDGRAGLKVYDVRHPSRVRLIATHRDIPSTYDVITLPSAKLLIMVGANQIIQYDYTNPRAIKKLSQFTVDLKEVRP